MKNPEFSPLPDPPHPGPGTEPVDRRLADMEVTDAAFDAWAWGSRRQDLPEWIRLALQQPSTLYTLLAGIQDGLALPPADSRESLTQRIARLAEATLTRLIEELLAEEAAQAGSAPDGPPVTASELSTFIGCAVDEAMAQAMDHADGADRALDRLLEPATTQRVLAEAMRYFSPTPRSSREELEVLAFRCARSAVDRVMESLARPSLSP